MKEEGSDKTVSSIDNLKSAFEAMGQAILGSKQDLDAFKASLSSMPNAKLASTPLSKPELPEVGTEAITKNIPYAPSASKIIPFPTQPAPIPGVKIPTPEFGGGLESSFKGMKDHIAKTKGSFNDLFSVKPSDQTQKSLGVLQDGLKNITSMSFQAKAAIIGALYALQQMMSNSGGNAVNLKNTGALTGIDTKTLQEYQFAGRQVGLTNEEILGSFENLQTQMANIKLGHGAPAGWAQFARTMGLGTNLDVQKFMEKPQLLMQKLQEYAKKEKDVGMRNFVLGSFVGKGTSSALVQQAFTPEKMAHAPIMSDKEIKGISAAKAMWEEFKNSMDRVFAGFSGAHGAQVIGALTTITQIGLKATGMFLDLADKFKLFALLDSALKPAVEIINMAGDGISQLVAIAKDAAKEFQIFGNGVDGALIGIGKLVLSVTRDFLTLAGEIANTILQSAGLGRVVDIVNSIIGSIKNLIGTFPSLIKSIVEAASKFDIFKTISSFIDGFLGGFENVLSGIMAMVDKVMELFSGGNLTSQLKGFLGNIPNMFSGLLPDFLTGGSKGEKIPESAVEKPKTASNEEKSAGILSSFYKPGEENKGAQPNLSVVPNLDLSKATVFEAKGPVFAPNLKLVTPNAPIMQTASSSNWRPGVRTTASSKSTVNNINIDQDLNFQHTGKNSKETGDSVKKAINDAFRQLPSQLQGT